MPIKQKQNKRDVSGVQNRRMIIIVMLFLSLHLTSLKDGGCEVIPKQEITQLLAMNKGRSDC